jgi:endonuclease-3 related protein
MPAADWRDIHATLLARFGAQHWWPGDTAFEIMVGAVLTQNTAWRNVEAAIARLKAAGRLAPAAMLALPEAELAGLIRAAGYFNVKARRLRALCAFLVDAGVAAVPEGLATTAAPDALRRQLLAVHGVGEETADSILLYALGLPSFVVDAYTRRIFSRLGRLRGDETYAAIQAEFVRHLPRDAVLYNEYHALIVRLGKDFCRPRPRCADCPLVSDCPGIGID